MRQAGANVLRESAGAAGKMRQVSGGGRSHPAGVSLRCRKKMLHLHESGLKVMLQ